MQNKNSEHFSEFFYLKFCFKIMLKVLNFLFIKLFMLYSVKICATALYAFNLALIVL